MINWFTSIVLLFIIILLRHFIFLYYIIYILYVIHLIMFVLYLITNFFQCDYQIVIDTHDKLRTYMCVYVCVFDSYCF